MLRSLRLDSPRDSTKTSSPLLRVTAASVGLCALLYGSSLHAQGAPQSPSPSAPTPTASPYSAQPAAPMGAAAPAAGQPSTMPYQPQPAPGAMGQAQPGYPPPQGYGYGYPPYGPYPPSPYPPPPYYAQPYYYEQPPPPPPPTKRNSSVMMGVGITMVAVGSVGFLAGLAALASANNRIDIYCDGGSRCGSRDDTGLQAAGGVLMVVGGLVTVGGIPLWVIGGRKVPLNPEGQAPDKGSQAAIRAPTLHIGPSSASLSFSF